MKYELKHYELDWVLAGLRMLDAHLLRDRVLYGEATKAIADIACERKEPTAAMVSKLCEELNTHQRSDAIRPDADDIVERKPGSRLLKCFAVVAGDHGFIIAESVSQDSGTAILRFMKREPNFLKTGWAGAQKLGYRLVEFTFAEMESRTFAEI